MPNLLWALAILQAVLSRGCLSQREEKLSDAADPGEPLFLTPYIERGDIAEARRLARVELNLQMESYAGFFTVNKDHGSNQFLWYFPCMTSEKDKAPVVLWLQGGPGASSMLGVFVENGPIEVNELQYLRRQYHWALNHHLIYIDNPVGAGFSFTQREQGYCTNETQVGEQLYSTVTQFFQLFPELQANKFFITGEYYAGKFAPALAYTIHKKNSAGKNKLNLKGLVIGEAWINPESQKNFLPTGMTFENNYKINLSDIIPDNNYIPTLANNTVRKAIHVGNLPYKDFNWTVLDHLKNDYWQSMAPWLSELLDYYPVTLYGGEGDEYGQISYDGVVDFLRNHFNFTGVEEYRAAKQYEWELDDQFAGCVRRARLLTDIYVAGGRSIVPLVQPKRAWDMITRITHGKSFEQGKPCPRPRPKPDNNTRFDAILF